VHLTKQVGDNVLALCQADKQWPWPYAGAQLEHGGEWIIDDVPDDAPICWNCRRAKAKEEQQAPPPKPPRKTAAEKRREAELAKLAAWIGKQIEVTR
jgi:hypothetical protein